MFFSVRKIQAQTQEGKALLHPTSFEVKKASILGVYGPNGSSNTTLLKTIAGVGGHFQLGEIWIDSQQIKTSMKSESRVQKIIYLGSDFSSPYDVRVHELLELGRVFSQNPQPIEAIIDLLDLRIMRSRVISTLSDGEKQWVMFARALIQNPKIMVLDESFSKLDLDRTIQAMQVLKNQTETGMTFVIASNDINFLSEVSDELALMQNGNLLFYGEPKEVLNSHNLKKLFPELSETMPLHIVKSPNTGKERVIY